jgi:hypothetical protein
MAKYETNRLIDSRLRERDASAVRPVFVGLLNRIRGRCVHQLSACDVLRGHGPREHFELPGGISMAVEAVIRFS